MNSFLNESKDAHTLLTRSTFYSRPQSTQKPQAKQSRYKLAPKENSFFETSTLNSFAKTSQNWRPLDKLVFADKQRDIPNPIEKLRVLSIKMNFQNKYNMFSHIEKPKQLNSFLKPQVWKSNIVLSKKDQLLKSLLSSCDFSLRTFSWHIAFNFKQRVLKLSELIDHLEGRPIREFQPIGGKVITKYQIMEALIPDNKELRNCLLSKNRSTGSYKDRLSADTMDKVCKIMKLVFSN